MKLFRCVVFSMREYCKKENGVGWAGVMEITTLSCIRLLFHGILPFPLNGTEKVVCAGIDLNFFSVDSLLFVLLLDAHFISDSCLFRRELYCTSEEDMVMVENIFKLCC